MTIRTRTCIAAAAILFSARVTFGQGFVQQGPRLFGTPPGGLRLLGASVALSADGNTAIVGELGDGLGGAWIYARTNGVWQRQGPKLSGTGTTSGLQGTSVAISADGNTAAIGGPYDNVRTGAVWIFVRSGGTWTQQGSKLFGTGGRPHGMQGTMVDLSADGNTLLFGGCTCDPEGDVQGSAFVFTRSGGVWTQQGPVLSSGRPFTILGGQFGVAGSLSDDGNTAVVGEPGDGAAWVFTRSGSTWTRLEPRIVPDTGATGGFGRSVAISGDGMTIAIGGAGIWTFVRTGGTFPQSGSSLGEPAVSVSLSGNGALLLEGVQEPTGHSKARAYSRTGSDWVQLGQTLAGVPPFSSGGFSGSPVALSSDGLTAILGEPGVNGTGAAWPFTRAPSVLPPHAAGDFDGDHLADPTIVSPDGTWVIRKSTTNTLGTVMWGNIAGYVPVRGDFDGDGRQDSAIYNAATGNWVVILSATVGTFIDLNWGGIGDTPVPGDYDGDGTTDIAVYNSTSGLWRILESSRAFAASMNVNWGGSGYTPVPAQDFDGDFVSDIGVYQRSTGTWSILQSTTGFTTVLGLSWGGPGYTLVPGDYDGDRKADFGLYQQSSGLWSVLQSSSGYTTVLGVSWGGPGTRAVPGDYDGDGRIDLCFYRPTEATPTFHALLSGSSFASDLTLSIGTNGGFAITTAIAFADGDATRASDFDADARAEITVYNTSTGVWSMLNSGANYTTATNIGWGGTGYQPVPGDYDGDGKVDLGLYQSSSGNWYVLLSGANFTTSLSKNAGGAGWIPVAADYDGDGRTDFVVYNTTTGQWYGLKSGANYTTTVNITYGGAGYDPVPGDYDGDGRADIAVDQNGTWSILFSSTNNATSLTSFAGGAGYVPVPADYDGDGRTDIVAYNTTTGRWSGVKSGSNFTLTFFIDWGGTGYLPAKGDYDGDGKTDFATYVQSSGTWYILLSGANYTTVLSKNWGGVGYSQLAQFP